MVTGQESPHVDVQRVVQRVRHHVLLQGLLGLLAEIARTHKRMEPGMSYSAYHFTGPPASKRARTTERADTASSTTSASTES